MSVTLKLHDGKQITADLSMGGMFTTQDNITKKDLSDEALRKITVTGTDWENKNIQFDLDFMRCDGVENTRIGKCFSLYQIPAAEIEKLKTDAKIEYLAMMSDVDLPE